MWFIGVDVGANGGIAIVDTEGAVVMATKMPPTDADILKVLPACPPAVCRAMLEKVHSSPQMGVASAFSFGASYGRVRMALTAAGVPFDEVTPQRWQRVMGCLSGGDKNVTKQRCQQVFPHQSVYHYNADALLLAEYCRRVHSATSVPLA